MGARRSRGQGSVYQRADQRWCAAVTLPNGKRRVFYAGTRREAEQKRQKALGELEALAAGADRLTVAQWLWRWHADTIAPNRTWNTVQSFERIIRLHLVPELGQIRLRKLAPADVQALLAARLRAGYAPASVSGMRVCLRAALNQALRWGYVTRNAAALSDPVSVPKSDPPEVTPERALALLEALKGHRHGNLFALILATGLRHSEALGLCWEDVDTAAGVVRARRQLLLVGGEARLNPLKKDGRPKTIYLIPFGLDALRREKALQAERRLAAGRTWADRMGLVFTADDGRPLRRNSTWHTWSRLLARHGLEHLTVHDLRHACASLLAEAGVPPRTIADWLGHSNVDTTLNVYTHALGTAQRDAAQRLARLLEGASENVGLHLALHSDAESPADKEGTG